MIDPDGRLGSTFAQRYRMLGVLGEGGMGRVYRVYDEHTGDELALKVIHRHLATDPRVADRFRREMRIALRLDGPCTARVYGLGETEDGDLYLAMELLRGHPLSVLLDAEGAIAERRLRRIGAQMALSLAAAHARGVVHRDLKPENAMLLGTPGAEEVRLLDFGVSRLIADDDEDDGDRWQTLTRHGTVVGTLRYMSPEQITCEPLDARSDLYSLGVVLYEMAAGQPPFSCETAKDALNQHVFETPPPLPPGLGLSPGLEELIFQLLSKEPEQRPQTAAEVAQRLDAPLVRMSAMDAPEPAHLRRATPGAAPWTPPEPTRKAAVQSTLVLEEPDTATPGRPAASTVGWDWGAQSIPPAEHPVLDRPVLDRPLPPPLPVPAPPPVPVPEGTPRRALDPVVAAAPTRLYSRQELAQAMLEELAAREAAPVAPPAAPPAAPVAAPAAPRAAPAAPGLGSLIDPQRQRPPSAMEEESTLPLPLLVLFAMVAGAGAALLVHALGG